MFVPSLEPPPCRQAYNPQARMEAGLVPGADIIVTQEMPQRCSGSLLRRDAEYEYIICESILVPPEAYNSKRYNKFLRRNCQALPSQSPLNRTAPTLE